LQWGHVAAIKKEGKSDKKDTKIEKEHQEKKSDLVFICTAKIEFFLHQ
jgi:hypothetical protein